MSVEIRPAEHVELVAVLNEYPSFAVAGGVQVSLGDAYIEAATERIDKVERFEALVRHFARPGGPGNGAG